MGYFSPFSLVTNNNTFTNTSGGTQMWYITFLVIIIGGPSSTTNQFGGWILVNNLTNNPRWGSQSSVFNGNSTSVSGNAILIINNNDFIRIGLFQNSGDTRTVAGSANWQQSYLMIKQIA